MGNFRISCASLMFVASLLVAETAYAAPKGTGGSPAAEGSIASKNASSADVPCLKGQDIRTSELCAQWKAADAAYDASLWTQRAVWLSSIIGVLTLVSAVAAAVFAGMASQYTKAAFKVVQHVEDANLMISFPSGKEVLGEDGPVFVMNMAISNDGRSVARIHCIEINGNQVIMDVKILPNGTHKLPSFAIVPKVDGPAQMLDGYLEYTSPLRIKAKLRVTAAILNHDGKNPDGIWGFVTSSYPEGGRNLATNTDTPQGRKKRKNLFGWDN